MLKLRRIMKEKTGKKHSILVLNNVKCKIISHEFATISHNTSL